MPKVSKLQASFNTGEISKLVEGRVDNERYDTALKTGLNYIPTIQGPLIRRPGTRYVSYPKDNANLPVLIPFQFSVYQNYMLEFGDKYIRFFTNEGQVVTSSNVWSVRGSYNQPSRLALLEFTALRPNPIADSGESLGGLLGASSLVSAGAVLELPTWYSINDVNRIKFTQKQDTLYLTHPSYPPCKLIRRGTNFWDLKQIITQDGPYLALNSYLQTGDAANIGFEIDGPGLAVPNIQTTPWAQITNAVWAVNSTAVTITASGVSFSNGDKVFVSGVQGATNLNNVTFGSSTITGTCLTNSTPSQAYWTVTNTAAPNLDLYGATLNSNFIGSTGMVRPALFQLVTGSSGTSFADNQIASSGGLGYRSIGLIQNGNRYWGNIVQVLNAGQAIVLMGLGQTLPNSSAVSAWQLGVYNQINGYPSACCFHQDRLIFGGCPGVPQEIDGSMSGLYEVFSASGSTLQVNNNNALQFGLNSQDLNTIRWVKSNAQGLLVGTQSSEWTITPSTQAPALYPTNIKADQVTYYGSYDTDAVQAGNAALYIQRAQRKIRELLYFWQVGSFRSTDLSELSEHLSLPSVVKLASQKETYPIIWGLRSDGQLISMSYSRDDVTLRAGWSKHQLGGRSDASGSPPLIKSMAVIPSSDSTYDELWMVVQRYTNGSTLGTIEYLTKPFDDSVPQEKAYHFDCGATYDTPITVTGIVIGSTCVVTAPNHGLLASSVVRFYNTIGLNISTTDADGNTTITNQLNENTFVVASTSTNAFKIQDFSGRDINTNSSSIYVGSSLVRKLVTTISGLGWLAGEQVSILADGGIHVNTSVTQAGTLTLAYPAAIVQIGYGYNSDGQLLRTKDGSAQGSSIGSTRRVNRVAFMLHNVGDLSIGPTFTKLIPAEFYTADVMSADTAPPLFDGIYRDGIESDCGFDDTICFRQSSGLPGMIQAITRFLEEQDV